MIKLSEYKLLKELWRNTDRHFSNDLNLSILEKIFMSIIIVIRSFSLVNIKELFKNKRLKSEISEFYVVLWFVILIILLFSPIKSKLFIYILTIYRLIDGINYRLAIVFVDRYQKKWGLRSLNRTIILLIINLFEIVLIFAILYIQTQSIGNKEQQLLCNPLDAIYFSLVTLTTLGYGDWIPINNLGEILIIAQLIIAFIFTGLVISFFMTGFKDIIEIRKNYK